MLNLGKNYQVWNRKCS